MKSSNSLNVRLWKTVVISLVLLALVGGWWLGRAGPVSWAAPGQQPHQQTVPTRPPTATPVTPTSTPLPPAETPDPSPDGDGEDDRSAPTPLPTAPDAPPLQPQAPPPGQDQIDLDTDQGGQAPGPPAPRAGEVEGGSGIGPVGRATPQPLELELPEPVETEEPALVEAKASAPPATPLPESVRWGQADQSGWLTWLYALLLGLVLIAIGFYLVNRA